MWKVSSTFGGMIDHGRDNDRSWFWQNGLVAFLGWAWSIMGIPWSIMIDHDRSWVYPIPWSIMVPGNFVHIMQFLAHLLIILFLAQIVRFYYLRANFERFSKVLVIELLSSYNYNASDGSGRDISSSVLCI